MAPATKRWWLVNVYSNQRGQSLTLARAVALDGHGVVYSRRREVVDALVDSLVNLGALQLPAITAKSLYLSLQERVFAGDISYEDMLAELAQHLGLPSTEGVAQLHAWIQSFSAEIVIDPELPFVLFDLRSRGVKVGMITNSIHSACAKTKWLEKHGIAQLFDLIVSSVDERCHKPDAEIFRRFIAKVSLPPECTAFIGHDEAEVDGAKKAGMITICLRCSCHQADYTVSRLAEVLDLPIWPPRKQILRKQKEE